MWDEIPIAGLLGTVKAVAMPGSHRDIFHIWTDRGLFTVHLDGKRKTYRDHAPPHSFRRFRAAEGDFIFPDTGPMSGVCGPDDEVYRPPTRTDHPSGQRLAPDPAAGRLLVRDAAGAVVLSVADFPAGTAAWTAAGFSECGRYLVVGSPGMVRAFRFVPAGDRAIPTTHNAGGPADRAALLQAVFDRPDDDLPRLVYADWLEEHGDPARAEFIRVQCRIAVREAETAVPESDPDAARCRELEAAHAARWRAETGVAVRGTAWHGFRRGFPGTTVFSAVALVRAANRLAARVPVELVRVSILSTEHARALAKSAALARVRDLTVCDPTAGTADPGLTLRTLLASPHAAGFRVLRVLLHRGCNAMAEAVAAAGPLPALTGVDFPHGTLTERGALALARSPHLPRVAWVRCKTITCPPAAKRELRKRFPGMKL